MDAHIRAIGDLLRRVRARWFTLVLLRAVRRAATGAGAVIVAALMVSHWSAQAPAALAVTALCAVALLAGVALWGAWPLRTRPSDARVARFIEERAPLLEDRLASAIDLAASGRSAHSPAIAEPMLADAASRARQIDLDAVVPAGALRRAGFQALAAAILLASLVFVAREPAREAYDAAWLVLFPAHVRLVVTPGDARITAGTALTIEATLAGSRAPVAPQVQIGDGANWRAASMHKDAAGRFRLALEAVTAPFTYRVVAGAVASPTYTIAVAHPPRVTRVDVDYTFPAALGLKPRTEEDGGDIYAPAGTGVRVRIRTDRPAAQGRLTFSGGQALALSAFAPDLWTATLKVVEDTSYRIALADREGRASAGDTEYFIRTLEDRPPEVHIVKPAGDRAATRLEEVDVEAQADDDYAIARLDLVYSVGGAAERTVPFQIPPRATSVTSRRTLYLEDLDVQPGDFVSYYVRARDLTRGTRPNESRSDIFFLEVKPFEQEFSLAQSQSMAGSGYNGSIDELVAAQKDVVVATFKLDRRARSAKNAQSEQDVRSVSRTEADLKSRVEQTSSSLRESTMRDPRRPQRGGAPRAGQTMPEEDSMSAAAEAMGRAVNALDALKTGDALPREMEALNALLKAQAQVKERQVARQASGAGGPGNNNRNYDVTTLFDKELQRAQQSNYETRTNAEPREHAGGNALDKIKDLARRQDELLRRQQELARTRDTISAGELERQLEQLTREQSELRQRAEDLANSQRSGGQRSGSGGQRGEAGNKMREIGEEMRNAAGELRRQDPGRASASGSRAAAKLHALERQMQGAGPDNRRRAIGDLQLETRQLADAERHLAAEAEKAGPVEAGNDAMRRLAGEQERLAERTRALQDGLKREAAGPASTSGENKDKNAASDAARRLDEQRLAERMRQSAEAMRGGEKTGSRGSAKGAGQRAEDMARALDHVADTLAGGAATTDEARKLSQQLARAQSLRERVDSTSRAMEKLDWQNGRASGEPGAQKTQGQAGRSGQGQDGSGASRAVLAQLREQYARQLKETQDLVDATGREDPNFARGGAGFTFEGQGMTLSAPGTEAFKQDFANWQELRRQATTALDRVESSLSKKLQAQESKDRLAAGVEDQAPPAYQKQVDNYFKALAARKKQ